jgi:hypothetical protein
MGMGMVPQVQFIVFYIGEADLGGGVCNLWHWWRLQAAVPLPFLLSCRKERILFPDVDCDKILRKLYSPCVVSDRI